MEISSSSSTRISHTRNMARSSSSKGLERRKAWEPWTLKHLVLEHPSSSGRNEFGDELDFENPSIMLRCHNPQFRFWLLDPSGQYRVRGVLLRSLRPEEVRLVVLVQPEMERGRSPLVSIPPFGRRFSKHRGLPIRCGLLEEHRREASAPRSSSR